MNLKRRKSDVLEELGQDHFPVVRRVSRIISPRAVFLLEKDKAGVLDPVALGRSDGEQNPLRQTRLRRELHFVVGLGEHQGFPGYILGRFPFTLRDLVYGATDAGAQFFYRECVRQAVENLPVEVAHEPEFLKLPLEQGFFKRRVGHLHRLQAVAGGQVHGDAAVGVQYSAAKSDRGNMPLGRGA